MTSTLKRASALALFFCLLSLALPSSAQVRITGNGPQVSFGQWQANADACRGTQQLGGNMQIRHRQCAATDEPVGTEHRSCARPVGFD